ncbi:hypothetical protein ASG43_18260 [Aureimonas sp. Leaf454]|nr:hypothetical protein ASG43_18260 [Aureimonas sp. Leaf454]
MMMPFQSAATARRARSKRSGPTTIISSCEPMQVAQFSRFDGFIDRTPYTDPEDITQTGAS